MKSSGLRSAVTTTAPAPARAPAPAAPGHASDATGMLALQQTVGNRAARAMIAPARQPAAAPPPPDDAGAALPGDGAEPAQDAQAAPATAIARSTRPAPFEISMGAPSAADDAADPELARLRVVMLADEVRGSGVAATATVASALAAGEAGLGRRAERATARLATEIDGGLATVTTMFGAERTSWAAAFARGEAAVVASKVLHQGLAWVHGAAALVGISGQVKQARDRVESSIRAAVDRIDQIRDTQQRRIHDRTGTIAQAARDLGDRKAQSYQDGDRDLRASKRAAVHELANQFADGVTAKEAQAKQAVADGLAELPGGLRGEGDKVLAKLEDPAPQLAPTVGDAARTTGDQIAAQANAGRDALREFARTALGELASGEAAVRDAIVQLRTAAADQVRRAAQRGREALRQTARKMTAELTGMSADAAQALLAEARPSVARSRQLVGWVKQQQQLGAQRFAEAIPAAVGQLARPIAGITGATTARVRGVGKRVGDWLAAQRVHTSQQLDTSLVHIGESLAAILTAFVDVLGDTQRQIRDKLVAATDDIDAKFQEATRKADREVTGKVNEAYDQVEAGVTELGEKMDDTVDQIDWDDRHPVLAVIRDVAAFIAGEIWGLIKFAFKLVAALVVALIAIIALVVAGLSLAVAAAIVAVAAIALLVYQIGAATYRRYREAKAAGDDRGFWANLGLGFSDVAGLTKIYHAFTAKGLTPFQRGEAYIDGVGDLAGVVLTVAGARGQLKEIRLSAAEPIPYAEGAALEGTSGLAKVGRALRIEQIKVENGGMPRSERARAIFEGLSEAGGSAIDRVRSWSRGGPRPAAGPPAAGPPAADTPATSAATDPAATAGPAASARPEPTAAARPEPTTTAAEPTARPEPTTTAAEPTARPEPASRPHEAVPSDLERPALLEPASDPAGAASHGAAADARATSGGPPPTATPGKTIFEPFVGDSLASPTDLMARNPGSTVTASEATLMPSAEQVAAFEGRGGRFLTDRFGESLPANSIDELHVRYPLPHQKSTEMALRLTPEELADPVAAVQARMAAIESLHNLAPEALRTLQPEGTLELIFAEKEIISEVDGVKRLRWTDPQTGTVYRFDVVSPPRAIPRAEANAPYSGLGIPKSTTEVYIAKLRKAAVPEAMAHAAPEGGGAPGGSPRGPAAAPEAGAPPPAPSQPVPPEPTAAPEAGAPPPAPSQPVPPEPTAAPQAGAPVPAAPAPDPAAPAPAGEPAPSPGARLESAKDRLLAMRKRAAEDRARAEAERIARRTPEEELAATEYRSDAAHRSKQEGARFGVDQATVTAAGNEYRATFEQRYLEARRNGAPAEQAKEIADAAAAARMNDIILKQATADAPRRARADALADRQRRGVPDAFLADDAIQQQNFRDIAPDAHGQSVRGQTAREISPELVGKTVSEMEQVASGRGGVRSPASGVEDVRTNRVDDLGAPRLNPDGSPESYSQITYNFPDGTRVRIKPGGDKINSADPMYSVELVHPDAPRPGPPQESVAFKYDAQGRPVPKGPGDIRNPYPANSAPHQAYQDALLEAGHLHGQPGTAAPAGAPPGPVTPSED